MVRMVCRLSKVYLNGRKCIGRKEKNEGKKEGGFHPLACHLPFGFGGLLPLPPPDGLPVVLGALTGLGLAAFAIV